VTEKSGVVVAVCDALRRGSHEDAARLLREQYPFEAVPPAKRQYGPLESTRVFVRDGFIDRYSGVRLLFVPALRVISQVLPAEFPYHLNWKTDRTHMAYWELGATIDHVQPITRGGADEMSNWVTTSMARNGAKAGSTLEEIGWRLHPVGDPSAWDGMLRWFLEYTAAHPEMRLSPTMREWRRAAEQVTR
jgi:hypothetical protein